MTSLFMPKQSGAAAAARESARRAAEESRERQQVANQRQLAELAQNDSRIASTRRNPRGRRLFTEDDKATLA